MSLLPACACGLLSALCCLAVASVPALAAPPARAVASSANPAPRDIVSDLGAAGRLRMQAQRVAKLYLQNGLAINATRSRQQLAAALRQGDTDIDELTRRLREPRAQKALLRVGEHWRELKVALAQSWSVDAVQRVNALAESQSIAAGRLSLLIEENATTPSARLLDLALRQSMLAQRLARLYLLAQAGDNSRGRLVDIEQTRREFVTSLAELASAPENTAATREALALMQVQWLFLDQAVVDLLRGGRGNPQHVATTSERLSEVLDAVAASLSDSLQPNSALPLSAASLSRV
ncbi:type IV pili methyl-accepting chemotaxis transducer N-terminal domain-containing protein [Rhodocyclus tenuis]|uniref:NarX-like N-terminal domain-containing protein n=1 Tax=Rhodocyclus tenuis TaxID=1066 RepID=A0A840GD06_RHOTE|nr:type IV pili methyl-accepting chemotaxis transducer N-terminal domain-containing protein [Rhodocyclus tenuis]MBB4246119.1 hypothetical protein [Rhodocyclus tenuis]